MVRPRQYTENQTIDPLGWMITFSDLITLLLTFFVLIISMSSMDIRSLRRTFGQIPVNEPGVLGHPAVKEKAVIEELADNRKSAPIDETSDPDRVREHILDFKDTSFRQMVDQVDEGIDVSRDERGLVIRLADNILFAEGESGLRAEYLPILSRIGTILKSFRQAVSIEGHADASSGDGGGQTRAWDLSLERAMAVLDFFTIEEKLPAERFRVGGMGASKPLAPGDSPENQSKNRRIEIVLYHDRLGR